MEYIEGYTHIFRKARRRHKCCECGGFIERGEQYHYHSGVFDHEGFSEKNCAICQQLREVVNTKVNGEDGCCFGELSEHLHDKEYEIFRNNAQARGSTRFTYD